MSRPLRASRRLAAIALGLSFVATPVAAGLRWDPDPAWRHADDAGALVAVLDGWLDQETDLPRRAAPPRIRVVTPAAARRLGGLPPRGHGRRRALYDPETATIHLVAPWRAGDARDVSILLHELVHHRQAAGHWYCAAAQEPAAYRLQEAWLAERGLVLDWPRLPVTLAAGCTRRDIHPE